MREKLLVGWIILLVAAGGCIADGEGAVDALPSSGDGAALSGVVVSEELFPVAGALVRIVDGPEAVTNGVGEFLIIDILAGSRTVNVTAAGYEPLELGVVLVGGERLEIKVAVQGLPGLSPHVVTVPFEGYSICQLSAVYTAGWPTLGPLGSPCPLGQPKQTHKVEVAAGWAAGVHEMTWRTAEEMIFASVVSTTERPQSASCTATATSHTWCPAMLWGKSPLRILARPQDPVYAAKYAIDGKEMWPTTNYTSYVLTGYSGYVRTEVNQTLYPACVQVNRQFSVPEHWGCPFGVGLAMGIRFQFYHTTFYLAAPLQLEKYSGLPDR